MSKIMEKENGEMAKLLSNSTFLRNFQKKYKRLHS